MDRRRYLAVIAATPVPLAGCFSDGDGDSVTEAIERAQRSTSDAASTMGYGSVDARTEIDDEDSIEAELTEARDSIAAARDQDPTEDESVTLDSLELGVECVRIVFEERDSFQALAAAVDEALTAPFVESGGLEDAYADAEDALENVIEVNEGLASADLERVDALDEATVEEQAELLADDVAAADAVATAHDPLTEGESSFWPPFRTLADGEIGSGAASAFEQAGSSYSRAADAVEGTDESTSFAVDEIECHAAEMQSAAKRFGRAVAAIEASNDETGVEEFYRGIEAVERAMSCGLRNESERPLDDVESGFWTVAGPTVAIDTEAWSEEGQYVVDGTITNLAPYEITVGVGVRFQDSDGQTRHLENLWERVVIVGDDEWSPTDPARFESDDLSEGELVVDDAEWSGLGP